MTFFIVYMMMTKRPAVYTQWQLVASSVDSDCCFPWIGFLNDNDRY